MVSLDGLAAMTPELRALLQQQHIGDSDALLEACRTPEARRVLAGRVGLDEEVVLILAHQADLARLRGLGKLYMILLEGIGVHSLDLLAACDPADLRDRLLNSNQHDALARRVPSLEMVAGWVDHAQRLPRKIEL